MERGINIQRKRGGQHIEVGTQHTKRWQGVNKQRKWEGVNIQRLGGVSTYKGSKGTAYRGGKRLTYRGGEGGQHTEVGRGVNIQRGGEGQHTKR